MKTKYKKGDKVIVKRRGCNYSYHPNSNLVTEHAGSDVKNGIEFIVLNSNIDLDSQEERVLGYINNKYVSYGTNGIELIQTNNTMYDIY